MAVFPSFIFDTSKGETPQTIAMKRALAAQIMGGFGNRPARNVGEGIGNAFASLGQGITANVMNRRANAAERAGQDSAASAFNPLLDAFRSRIGLDAGGFPAAPNPGDSTSMATMPAPDMASARVAQAHGDSTAPAGNLTESKQAFINALMPAAMQESQRTGIDPRIIVAQAAQETGWGRSAPGNNYFGIKSHGQGGGQTFATHEYVNGKRVNVRDSFRRFDSPADSVRGYGDFILKNPRYRPFMAAQGLDAQLEALQASGYATDPNYSRSVGAIARGIPLDSPVAANEAMATGGLPNGLTPDALQQWAFANYAPQPANSAVDAVNALGQAQPVGLAETEADILAQEQAMMGQDPQTFQQPGTMPRLQAPEASPPLPPAQFVQDRPVQAVQTPQDRGFPEMAGNNPQAIPAPGIDMQAIANVLTNPFSSPEQRAFAQMLLEQEMQSRDPMRQADLAYKQAQTQKLQRELSGEFGDAAKVQSSTILDDGTSVLVMNDGSRRVLSPTGEAVTGQAAADAIRSARQYTVENQREIYGGRRAGTLGADIELGGAAAGAAEGGKKTMEAGFSAWDDYNKIQGSIANIDEAIAALDSGAKSGIVYNMLPNVTEASASLKNAMDRMGLDVIGSVTFGALSEGEMRLAMETAVPRSLQPAELRNWLQRKRDAQEKASRTLADAAMFLTVPGNTINDWIAKNQSRNGGGAGAQGGGQQGQRLRFNPETGQLE